MYGWTRERGLEAANSGVFRKSGFWVSVPPLEVETVQMSLPDSHSVRRCAECNEPYDHEECPSCPHCTRTLIPLVFPTNWTLDKFIDKAREMGLGAIIYDCEKERFVATRPGEDISVIDRASGRYVV